MKERHTAIGHYAVGTLLISAERPDRLRMAAQQLAWIDERGKLRFASDRQTAAQVAAMLRDIAPELYRDTGIVFARHGNAYVSTGLNNSLDREFGLGGTAIGFIGVSSSSSAVTASTVNLNGASGGTAANTIIKAISPAATRSAQTTTGGATFVNGDFTSGVFIWNKIGFLTTSTDAGTGLVDVIGGTGGSAPFNRTFSVDLTAAGTFSVTGQIADTAVAV